MLDINLVREEPEVIENDLKKRGDLEKLKLLENIKKEDSKWRDLTSETNELRRQRNVVNQKIGELKKANKNADEELQEANLLADKITENEKKMDEFRDKIRKNLMSIPNILHDSVPVGKDESENVEIRKWGEVPTFDFEVKDHIDLGLDNDLFDLERAAKISGSRFYFLKGDLVELDLALQKFALDFLKEKGFKLLQPPFMIRRKPYEGVTDLGDFEDVMYKVEDEDLYLIATSEHPLVSMFIDEILEGNQLPMRIAGISPCFRKEAGSHGRDTKGIFRVHQFNKVEQVVFSRPEDSWKIHEELILLTEEIYQKLGLPYRIVNICTGDIGSIAAKKYDLDVWLPGQKKFREVASCSNCTDYQSRRLNTRFKDNSAEKTIFPHTLNNTAIATARTIVAIMENYQQKDGSIMIPEVLRGYMGGKTKIPS